MKKIIPVFLALPLLFAAMTGVAGAGGSAISTIAGIVMHLNHYPSDSEKKALDAIVNSKQATTGEKVLAGALMRMQHQVGGSDAEKLRALANNGNASKQERTLAEVLLGIAHHPSAADKERLKALISH